MLLGGRRNQINTSVYFIVISGSASLWIWLWAQESQIKTDRDLKPWNQKRLQNENFSTLTGRDEICHGIWGPRPSWRERQWVPASFLSTPPVGERTVGPFHAKGKNILYIKNKSSVADPGCLSRIPHLIFSIPNPGSKVKKILDTGSGSA